MDIEPGAVRMYLSRAERAGVVVRKSDPADPITRLLQPEINQWLLEVTPPGATIATVIAAIVRDAYFDENPLAIPQGGK